MSESSPEIDITEHAGNGLPAALPRGWAWVRLDAIAEVKGGITKDRKRKGEDLEELPYLRVANVQRGYLDLSEMKRIPVPAEKIEDLLLASGDVLFTEGGDRDKLGRGWVWSGQIDRCIYQNHVFRARLHDTTAVEAKFVSYFSNAFGQKYFMAKGKQTTNLASINKTLLSAFPIPLASQQEQNRIVAEIEKQFSRLDEAVANLKRVQANLKRYKAAVLKAAVEGKLTEEWRKQHPDVEPADQLLERILAERRAKWEEAERAKMKAKGKVLKGGKWKEGYKEPLQAGGQLGLKVPRGWTTSSIGQIVECLDSMRVPVNKKERLRREGSVPYYGANGQVGQIDGYLFDEPLVLVVEDETFIGRTAPFSYRIDGKAWVNNHAHVLRAANGVDTDFLNVSLMHYPFIPLTTGTTGRRKLTQKALMSAPYLLPPLEEQGQIVAEVGASISVVDAVSKELEKSFARADRLRQSILQKAFSGQLVPQDPADEPASVLLERLRAERAKGRARLAPPRKAVAAKASRGAPTKEPAGQAPPYAAAILGFMKPGQEYFRSDVVAALGLTVGQWNAGIRELKESGAVVQTGERRGARYALSG